ncbi:hypothetical protein ECANGB1_2129 [Enterospora canceri]|uniref:Nudix hydrolase domain-containing protein n=1 Tax=Enterospora canceri TaxID=1081671 RepID=A0A1Y1S538_9MICR|nr:hypothetical protein ECANGB1_2129 [Enterospora canceri]
MFILLVTQIMTSAHAGTIPIYKGQIVLTLSKHNHFIFPKGNIEKNETASEAAVRETMEESGCIGELFGDPIKVKHEGYTIVYYKMHVTKIHKHFEEEKRRKLLMTRPQDAVDNKQVALYVRKIIHDELVVDRLLDHD